MDIEDLEVIASHVQDAILYVADIDFTANNKQLSLAINRCHNENNIGVSRMMRSHAGLVFSHVEKMQVQGIDRSMKKQVLSLLAIEFKQIESPAGIIELKFANNASIKLEVNCLEVFLKDIGEKWQSDVKANHKI